MSDEGIMVIYSEPKGAKPYALHLDDSLLVPYGDFAGFEKYFEEFYGDVIQGLGFKECSAAAWHKEGEGQTVIELFGYTPDSDPGKTMIHSRVFKDEVEDKGERNVACAQTLYLVSNDITTALVINVPWQASFQDIAKLHPRLNIPGRVYFSGDVVYHNYEDAIRCMLPLCNELDQIGFIIAQHVKKGKTSEVRVAAFSQESELPGNPEVDSHIVKDGEVQSSERGIWEADFQLALQAEIKHMQDSGRAEFLNTLPGIWGKGKS
jgi:hypothetical protein